MKWLRTMMIACFIFSIFPIKSEALSCVELTSPIINNFDMAVVGTVLNIKQQNIQPLGSEPKQYVLMEVEKSWKQQVDSQIIFEADFTWSYPYDKGEKYLVYLYEDNGQYINSPCSPVEEVRASNDYEADWGEGIAPKKEVHLNYKIWFMTGKIYEFLFGLMILVGIVIFIRRIYLKRKGGK